MKHLFTALIVLAIGCGEVQAFESFANVVSVTPITEMVNRPTQNCWTEYQQITQAAPQQRDRDVLGAVIGGVAGGLLGSQIGRGAGRVAGAAVGAGVGAIVGDRLSHQESGAATAAPIQRCQQVDHFENVTTAYNVVYEYDGQRFSSRLPYNPGNQLRINVSITPR
jgi:uncharacterized protein YcfJ